MDHRRSIFQTKFQYNFDRFRSEQEQLLQDMIVELDLERRKNLEISAQLDEERRRSDELHSRLASLERNERNIEKKIEAVIGPSVDGKTSINMILDQIKANSEKISSLESKNADLQLLYESECDKNRDLQHRLVSHDEVLLKKNRELSETNGKLEKLMSKTAELEIQIEKDATKYAENDEKLKSREDMLTKEIDGLKEKLTELPKLQDDLRKANEIINKYLHQVHEKHERLNLLNHVATAQEEMVGEKEQRLKKFQHDLKMCLERIKLKETELQMITDERNSLKKKFEESQQKIKTNENVIVWLNKQLADAQEKFKGSARLNEQIVKNGEVKRIALGNDLPRINVNQKCKKPDKITKVK